MRTKGVAILAGAMFVSSTFAATDAPAARPLATANIVVQQAKSPPDLVLLTISDPALDDGIAIVAPRN